MLACYGQQLGVIYRCFNLEFHCLTTIGTLFIHFEPKNGSPTYYLYFLYLTTKNHIILPSLYRRRRTSIDAHTIANSEVSLAGTLWLDM